jgi:oligopeptide transport system substrate-binding protein
MQVSSCLFVSVKGMGGGASCTAGLFLSGCHLNYAMKSKYALSAALTALAFSTSQLALAVTVPPGVTLAASQEITRQMPVETESLDPAHIESWAGNTIGLDLFEGLTRIDAAGAVAPGVAESWTRTAPDTWLFKLRHDARWSNGQPLTAADFVYSWQRVVDPKTGSKYTVLVEFVKNANAVLAGKAPLTSLGVRAVDPYTLEVKTEAPTSFFPQLTAMSTMAPVNRAAVTKFGNEWTRPGNIVSDGAYSLVDWQPGNRLVMTKSDKYWDASKVVITKVTYLPIESDETALRMYEAGQFDYTYTIPSGVYGMLSRQFTGELKTGLFIATYYYSLNNDDPAFRDKRVRQALSMVIDRNLLTSKLTASGELPLYGLISKGTQGAAVYQPDWAGWPMAKRVEYARDLLKQAGYSDAKPLTFTLTYNTNDLHKKVALFTTSEWRTKLGVNVKLENVENRVLLKMRHDGKIQASRDGWFVDYNDAMSYFDLIRCNSVQNDQRYCNPRVDTLVDQANQQMDDAHRTAMLTQAHEMAMNDYPLIPMFQYSAVRLVKSYVGGYTSTNYVDQRQSQDMYLIRH